LASSGEDASRRANNLTISSGGDGLSLLFELADFYVFDTYEIRCYTISRRKSKNLSRSSDRNSFGTSLLLCFPCKATEHPLCRFDEELGILQRSSHIPEAALLTYNTHQKEYIQVRNEG
jgi:hypothetical protein